MNFRYINKNRLKLLALSGVTILNTNICYTKEYENYDIEEMENLEYAYIVDRNDVKKLKNKIIGIDNSAEVKYKGIFDSDSGKLQSYYDKYNIISNEDEFNYTINGEYINYSHDNIVNKDKRLINKLVEEKQKFNNAYNFKIDNLGVMSNVDISNTYLPAEFSNYTAYLDSLYDNSSKPYSLLNNFYNTSNDEYLGGEKITFDNISLDGQIDQIGYPVYADRLRNLLNSLNTGLKQHIINTNLRIVLLEGEYSADDFYAREWYRLSQNITGVRLPYEIGNKILV